MREAGRGKREEGRGKREEGRGRREAGSVRILHVAAPAPFGGLERVVLGLTSALKRGGHEVRVALVLDPGVTGHPLVTALDTAGVPVDVVQVAARGYRDERRRVTDLCRTHRMEVIHTHGYRPDVVDGGVGRKLGIPWVTTVHGFTGGGGFKGRLYEWLQERSYRRADAVIAVSKPIVGRLTARGVPGPRIHVIQNAWDGPILDAGAAERARAPARKLLGVEAEGFRVGWVGRLSPEKGPDVMVNAITVLGPQGVCLSMVGDGGMREALLRLAAQRSAASYISWHGAVPDSARLMPAFDALVLSSRTEGTPMVLFEAMAAGVPIVATRVGGVPDVVGPAEALLVPSDDLPELARAVLQVRDHPQEARERANRARERLAGAFAAGPWAERHVELYRALIGARGRENRA